MSATIDAFSDWDAAYVLGALSTRERIDYEEHLAGCERCSAAVAEVAGMPALLSRVSLGEITDAAPAATLGSTTAAPAIAPPGTSPAAAAGPAGGSSISKHVPRRRRGRALIAAAVGVAALTTALVLTIGGVAAPPSATAETLHLASTGQTELTADVRVTGRPWGTAFSTHCRYGVGDSGDSSGSDGSDAVTRRGGDGYGYGSTAASGRYGLYVTDSAGDARLVSSWTAAPGSDVRADGSTDVPLDQIALVDIRALDSNDVLLRAALDR